MKKDVRKMNNVAIYLRKSREEEIETREETLARHERILNDYCVANKLNIAKTYKEVVSGESIEKRPRMKELLNDVENGLYNGVVVVELERLSRGNQIDQAEILEIFKKSKTKIYTLNKVYDLSSDNEFDEEFFEFGLFMSRREYKIIKRRLQRGKKQALKEGYYSHSNPPFGFTKKRINKGFVLQPHPVEADIVRTLFNKFVYEDVDAWELIRWLHDNGIGSKRVDNWSYKSIRRVLKNKTYIGYIATDYVNGAPTNYIDGLHDGIVDVETFELAQAKLETKKTCTKYDTTLKNPLASILKCAKCGRTMQSRFSTNKYHYYLRCPNLKCDNISTPTKYVEQEVIRELKECLDNYVIYVDNFADEMEKKRKANELEIDLVKKEIDKKRAMLTRCDEMLEEGIYSKEKYITRVNVLESDLKALQSNLEALKDKCFDDIERTKTAIPKLSKVLEEYWNLDATNKNILLKSIIDKIEYLKEEKNSRHNPEEIKFKLKIYLKI